MPTIRSQLQPKVEQPAQPQVTAPQSKYNVGFTSSTPEKQQRTQNTINTLFPGKTPEEVAHVTGAPEGSKVRFHDYGDGNLHVNVDHPQHSAQYNIHRDADTGGLNMHVGRYDSNGEKGLLHKRFKDTVDNASKLGVNKLTLTGSSDLDEATGKKDNGGYSWPRVGFNGPLLSHQFESLSPELQQKIDAVGPRDFHSLFKAGGADEWKQKHSSTGHLSFDLSPNSEHKKAFDAYHNSRELQRLGTPSTAITGSGKSTGEVGTGSNSPATVNPQPATSGSNSTAGTGAAVPAVTQQTDPASQRASRLDRIRNLGKFKRAAAKIVARYAAEVPPQPQPQQPTVNPLIKGTHLEHVLNHLQTNGGSLSHPVKTLAKQAMTVPEGADPHEHLANILPQLHKSLKFEAHPLAKQYNWHTAARGLHLDNAVNHSINVLASRYPDKSPYDARAAAFADIDDYRAGGNFPSTGSRLAKEALETVAKHSGATEDEINNSIQRHSIRHQLEKKDPSGEQLKQAAIRPDDSNLPLEVKNAIKFSRPTAAINFESALNRVNSRLGDTLTQLATKIHQKLKLDPHKVHKAIHDETTASTANTIQSVYHDDPDKVTAAAAHYGLLTETPSMAVFRSGEGPDSVHHFKAIGSGEKLRNHLDSYGIKQRILVPNTNGFSVFVLDPNSQMTDVVKRAASNIGSNVKSVKGITEIVGDGKNIKADKEARRGYRNVISEHQQENVANG